MSSGRRLFCVCAIGLGGALAMSSAAAAATGTFYVNHATGNDASACTAPGTPCKTIQAAVEKAEAATEVETAAIEVSAGTYTEHVTLNPSGAGITINGAGSGLGGTEIEGPESTGSSTVTLDTPGSAVALSNLSVVNDTKANTGKGIVAGATATLTNVVVTMEEPTAPAGIEANVAHGAVTMHGGGVTMEAGTEGAAIVGAPGASLNIQGANILVSAGGLGGGISATFATTTVTGTVVNVTSAVSKGGAIATDGGTTSLAEDTIVQNSLESNGSAILAAFPAPLSLRSVTVTMTNPLSKTTAVEGALGNASLEHLTVGGAWSGVGGLFEGGAVNLADSSITESASSKQPALAFLSGTEAPGLVVRRSVLQASPTGFAALFAANGNVTVDSSELLGGKSALLEEDSGGKVKTVTVAASTLDAGNLGVADGPPFTGVAVAATKLNGVINANVEGSIALESQAAVVGPEGHSANVVCSNSDVPSQVQAATATEGSIQCGSASAGNSATGLALFSSLPANYQLNPSSTAIDSVPAGAIALPFGLTPSSTDLAGNPRVVDGNGDCVAVQDKGALELQGHAASCPPAPPVVAITKPALAPALAHLTVSPGAFSAAPKGATVSKKHKFSIGAKVTYTDSEAATATFTVLRKTAGRTQGRSCKKPGKGNKHGKRCTLYVALGTFTHTDTAGANSFHFSGRLKGRKLSSGSYRLQAVAGNANGRSAQATATFTIK
jgi:hypothetical protein